MNKVSLLPLIKGLVLALPRSAARACSRSYLIERMRREYPTVVFSAGAAACSQCSFGKGVFIGRETAFVECAVGNYSTFNEDSQYCQCSIGSFCSMGASVLAGLPTHPLQFVSTSPVFYSPNHRACRLRFAKSQLVEEQKRTTVGSDVWVGTRATILGGVNVGCGAVIGAGGLVTKDVPPFAVVGGVPARVIKMRFDDKMIEFLLRLRWWEKPESWLQEHADLFLDARKMYDVLHLVI